VKGLCLSIGLGTVAGVDRRPGELIGRGMLHAELARRITAAPGASWCYVLTEPDGTPLHVGPIRRRPTQPWSDRPAVGYRNVEVWLQFTRDQLDHLRHHPPPGWEMLLTDIAQRIATSPGGAPNGDPTDRLPSIPLRRWINIRDRHCAFPGCRVAAYRCDQDHSVEYANAGPTADHNLAACCGVDHRLRHEGGWTVHQPTPGRIIWTSPLGHQYQRITPPGPTQAFDPMPNPTRPKDDWWHHENQNHDHPGWSPHTCLEHHTTPPQPAPQPEQQPKLKPIPPEHEPPPF
jgi:hypothetical protein